jgi:nitrite reductase/ring-hydroxylating ferredoxin subunit
VTALCAVDSVVAGSAVLVRLGPGVSVIVLTVPDGSIVAWRNACPHMGIELDWDARRLLTRDGRYLQCTGHGALFRLDNGVCLRGPCVGEALQRVAIRVEDGMVVVDE